MAEHDIRPTPEQQECGRENGWSGQDLERGYSVMDFDGTGMLEVCGIDDMGMFENDAQAVAQAMRDGYRFIPVEELPRAFDRCYLGWIDTPDNRQRIEEYTKMQAAGSDHSMQL